MAADGTYADVAALLVAWTGVALADVRAVTTLPDDLLAALAADGVAGIVRYRVPGGVDLDAARDRATVDVDTYVGPDPVSGEPDEGAAHDLAQRVRTALLRQLPGYVADLGGGRNATVQRMKTISRPVDREHDESPVRRYHGALAVTVATRG